MSTLYKSSKDVPTEVLTARLNQLADVVSCDRERIDAEFTMRVPAECDRDADLVLAEAADRLEALQAECEQLREHLQNMIDQTTPLEPVPGDPKWSRRIQLDEVIEERDSLRVEREKLRKDAERYQSILSAVLREIPHRRDVGGNAPGHGHTVPGIWDEDNGALAGKECAWCKIWNEAISAIQGGG